MSGVPQSSVARFFAQFVKGFAKAYFDDFVYFPDQLDEFYKITNLYSKLSLPSNKKRP